MDERSPRTSEHAPPATRAYLGIPTDIYIPLVPSAPPPRKAPSPPGLTPLNIPAVPPAHTAPATPKSTLAVTELIDDYYTPETTWEPVPDQLDVKLSDRKETRYANPARMTPSPSAYPKALSPGPTFGLGRSGSMISNRNALGLARQGSTRTLGMRFEENQWEMTKIRVKVRYARGGADAQVHVCGHTRAMSIPGTAPFADVIVSLQTKFPKLSIDADSTLLFKDEDGDMLSMVDEGDWEAGVDVAKVLGGKLEIWVE
jgi:neutrophil factor 2